MLRAKTVAVENAPPDITSYRLQDRAAERVQLGLQCRHVHIRNRDGVADPEDQQDEECKDDLLPQLGDAHALRIVWITLHHLGLSASCLRLPPLQRESLGFNGDLLDTLPLPRTL